MTRYIKKALKHAFPAPEPVQKNDFLLGFRYPRASRLDFFITQARYIRKRVWALSFVWAGAVVIALPFFSQVHFILWLAASFMPFLALVGIIEAVRGISCHMAELESSCKFNFSDVLLARLGVLGIVKTGVFALVIAAFLQGGHMVPLHIIVRLFAPYLLSCALALFFFNRFQVHEKLYLCGVAACGVSVINIVVFNPHNALVLSESGLLWASAALLLWTVWEVYKLIKRTVYTWNLSLTA